jgi:hypothetical protein
MHIQLPPRRREAVVASGRRTAGAVCSQQLGPLHGGGVERVQVVEITWRGWGGVNMMGGSDGGGRRLGWRDVAVRPSSLRRNDF